MQKSGGIRAGFQGLEGMVVPVKIKALAVLRSSDYRLIAGIAEALLHQGTSVENFVFNYLDWLLCKQKKLTMNFTFRSSVEHYYPQNPKEGNDRISNEYLHHFGNLCLISSSKNSALSNYMPTAKKEHYLKVKPDSIKQQLMMTEPNWGKDEIIEHGTAMIKVFQDEFS
jgi:hypothetical protein